MVPGAGRQPAYTDTKCLKGSRANSGWSAFPGFWLNDIQITYAKNPD
jgi:hypothetical protein